MSVLDHRPLPTAAESVSSTQPASMSLSTEATAAAAAADENRELLGDLPRLGDLPPPTLAFLDMRGGVGEDVGAAPKTRGRKKTGASSALTEFMSS